MLITRAPFRVSFFGGGTDFPEYFNREYGNVLATAIDKYSYVTASHFHSSLFNHAVRISYQKGEIVRDVAHIKHPVFRACLQHCKIANDIELHTVADLPSFAGLGSSSSFTVSLLAALYEYQGLRPEPLQLAYEAIEVERNLLGESVGMQDQVTAALGGFNIIEFHALDDVRVIPVHLGIDRLAELESHILLIFTGATRRASRIESRKLKNYEARYDTLRLMRRMVDDGYKILTGAGSLEPFGLLLDQTWKAKQSLERSVTNSMIEDLYNRGIEAGAWGGKLLGAGGGGFLLFCVPPECHQRVRLAFPKQACVPIHFNAPGVRAIYKEDAAR